MTEKEKTKVINIREMIQRNEEKKRKLDFINSELRAQIQNLEKESPKKDIPTPEQRSEQSNEDKIKFTDQLSQFTSLFN